MAGLIVVILGAVLYCWLCSKWFGGRGGMDVDEKILLAYVLFCVVCGVWQEKLGEMFFNLVNMLPM